MARLVSAIDQASAPIGRASGATSTSDTAVAIPAGATQAKVWVDVDSSIAINGAAAAITPGTGNTAFMQDGTQEVFTVHPGFRRDANGAPQSAYLHVAALTGTGNYQVSFYR